MKDRIKNAYKPAPERFRYAVTSAIREAEQSEQNVPVKKRMSHPARIVLAAVLILAIVPTAVFGATKLIGLLAKPVDKYGVELSMETTDKEYPQYVKMNVSVPDGFIVEPNTDGLKYSEVNSGGTFSLCPMRPKGSEDTEVVKNVDSYEEIMLCGHAAYRIKQYGKGIYDRVYVSYDDANVLLLIYYTGVSEEQLANFVGGISFTEGTASDHTELWELFDERTEDKIAYTFNYNYIELNRDNVMTFKGFSERNSDECLRYTAQIIGIRTADNVNDLDGARISRLYTDNTRRLNVSESLTDGNGNLLPRTVSVTQYGDGFTTTDQVLSSEEKDQSVILIDICYSNLSDEDVRVFIPYDLEVLNNSEDGRYTLATDIDPGQRIFSTDYCDREMFYNSDPIDMEKSYYSVSLGANETKTVTIGYRCCTDMLDKAYLTIVDASCFGIVDPAVPEADSDEIINYIIKVL